MTDVSVLIVGYNSRSCLDACMRHLRQAVKGLSIEVLFVNNGDDGSEEIVRDHFPASVIVPSQGNVGFAAGMNLLANHATGPLLLLLNPDVELHPDAIAELHAVSRDYPDYMILGSLAVRPDGTSDLRSLPSLPKITELLKGALGLSETMRQIDLTSRLVETEAVCGGMMMVRTETWREIGGMDETFFLYAEELDLCTRTRARGGRIGLVPSSKGFHDIGSGAASSPKRIQFLTTGAAHYYHKHFAPPLAWLTVFCLWLACFTRYVAGRLFGNRVESFASFRATYENVVTRPWSWWRGYASPGADPRYLQGLPKPANRAG
jgi:GT2 family glycosyltransferase